MKVWVVNEMCSEGFSEGNETFPYVFTDLNKAKKKAYECYRVLRKDWLDIPDDEEDDNETPLYSEKEFNDIMDMSMHGFYVLIQASSSHAQIEIYEVEVDDE